MRIIVQCYSYCLGESNKSLVIYTCQLSLFSPTFITVPLLPPFVQYFNSSEVLVLAT